jgi:hypothetical protein
VRPFALPRVDSEAVGAARVLPRPPRKARAAGALPPTRGGPSRPSRGEDAEHGDARDVEPGAQREGADGRAGELVPDASVFPAPRRRRRRRV